jgi:hypothetical protein
MSRRFFLVLLLHVIAGRLQKKCDKSFSDHKYFSQFQKSDHFDGCVGHQMKCGWSRNADDNSKPLLVITIGLQSVIHKELENLLSHAFDCIWVMYCSFVITSINTDTGSQEQLHSITLMVILCI